ncbi:DUF2163 domain-containing protein [Pseudoblastomonas halimionae]|uniref:DUF2163 domain-containing protein n=1 Tax=Alteriqipengyuania halimionae TaxID=1926630 RepID=A0A6I4U5L5_9SPHN|nr:DUF2163 domain-containing protein [Alteriqipengyuania halimionae]MXP11016.1 DUF2163 domain-containing protein [Alteriqipengyuania halimionae]
MSRVWFAGALETVATYWQVARTDGVTLGFVSHDRDLAFDGVLHRSAPGMTPSAIRKQAGFAPDSADVEGVLVHDAIRSIDLAAGRYDNARIAIGLVDWESLETQALYSGTLGEVSEDGGRFAAELRSGKAALERDPVPRTSPTCRADFCSAECGLSSARFTHRAAIAALDRDANTATLDTGPSPATLVGGWLRWRDGASAGLASEIVAADGTALILADLLPEGTEPGALVTVREGCDRTLATCRTRFANTRNFRGEPFLPGNDLLARMPRAR